MSMYSAFLFSLHPLNFNLHSTNTLRNDNPELPGLTIQKVITGAE